MKEGAIEIPDYALALKDSIGAEVVDVTVDVAELGLDDVLSTSFVGYEDFLAEVPLIKVAVSAYTAYRSFEAHHFQEKLVSFINKMNSRVATPEEIQRFKSKFTKNDKRQSKQVEYLLTIIDSYVGRDKPEMLAALYIAFLDGLISWQEFTCYAETIGRFLPGDYEWLEGHDDYRASEGEVDAAALRLAGLGLVLETDNGNPFTVRGNGNVTITSASLESAARRVHEYTRTGFGDRLVEMLAR